MRFATFATALLLSTAAAALFVATPASADDSVHVCAQWLLDYSIGGHMCLLSIPYHGHPGCTSSATYNPETRTGVLVIACLP